MKRIEAALVLALFYSAAGFSSQPTLRIDLSRPLDIGRQGLFFGSVTSAAEDDQAFFYVLDRMEYRVHKFSPQGNRLQSFGRKGQGPGDFESPGRIALTADGETVVCEDMGRISFFTADGNFIRRVDLGGRLDAGYVGPDRFYAWIWRPDDRQQVMVDADNEILNTFHSVAKDRFSVSVPDSSGRFVMFNYAPEAYAPSLIFAHNTGRSAVAVSNRYEITLLDQNGQVSSMIRRSVEPEKMSREEKRFFERDIRNITATRGWPSNVSRQMIKKIPSAKNFIQEILLSPEHVFVFRFGADVTAPGAPLPVDVFTASGDFLGTARMTEIPILISNRAMYFSRNDAEGNVFLDRMDYTLR